MICAMMAGPDINLESKSRTTRMGRERRDGPAMNGNRYDVSTSHPMSSQIAYTNSKEYF